MRLGEDIPLRERVRERDPVPLSLYRVASRLDRLTPDQLGRFADGLDAVEEFRRAAGAMDVSIQAAIDAGLLTKADVWGAFGMSPPD
jgi:hypothetical protein